MRSERLKVWAGLAAICVIWGSTWLAIKIGLGSVPPFLGVGFRFLVASGILFAMLRIRKVRIPGGRETRILYPSLVILTFAVPFALVYWSEQFIPSGLGSILFAAFPFWVAIFSQIMLPAEPLNRFKLLGILLGFAGLILIFSRDVHWTNQEGLLGMCGLLASTVMQGLSTVIVRKYGGPVSPLAMNFVGMSIGGVILVLLGLLTESPSAIVWDTAALGSILYLAVFGSVAAFVTYHWLLKRIEAVYLSLTSFINPIIAVILGALILDERLSAKVLSGAALVLLGILTAHGKYFLEKLRR